MKKRNCYIAWAVLFAVSAALGFIPEPEGVLTGLMVTVSLLFFVPPAMLLYHAVPRKQWATVRTICNLSVASLALTLVLLVVNFLSVGASKAAGDVLYVLLIILSAPMVCGQVWVLSLFLWACLLMVCLKYRKET